jgi:predicted MPP superfamily phosphohydrolase
MPFAYRSTDIMRRARVVDLTQHDSIEVCAAGDLHAGDNYCEFDMIRELCTWLAEKPNRYATIAGDLFNTAILGSVSLDLGEVNMTTKDARHLLARMMEPVRDRFLFIIPGNHDDRQTKSTGEDSIDALCCELGMPYFPEGEVFMRLKVGHYNHNASPVLYDIFATHGTAGGRLPGGKANALLALKKIVSNADVYLNGHGHTPLVVPDVAWRFNNHGNVTEQRQVFISCGSSLKRGGYPVKKSYPPLARVWPTFTLHGGSKRIVCEVEM